MNRTCSLLIFSSLLLSAQTAQNPLPTANLKDPDGQKVQAQFKTLPNSVQIYTCQKNGDAFGWSNPDPDAVMITADKYITVHHYKGPTWEATDGSIVRSEGPKATHYLPAQKDAVHWLELPAVGPTKQFGKLTFIHRIDTAGGLPPSKPCTAQNLGTQERVNYSATYVFYAPKY